MEITKKELKNIYHENSNKEACKKLGISEPTLLRLLKQHDIPLKQKGNRTKRSKLNVVG